jgi:ketosteroid isomerase-like protein
MSEALLQEILDRELIKELKARYMRFVDAKDWDGFRAVFTDDATFQVMDYDPIHGADNFVAYVREHVGEKTAHHGHMPELDFDSPTEASGTWALADYVEWKSDPETGERRGFKGCGRYHETYRKVDGEWKIATWRLSYLRMDPLYPEPLPDKILGGPALLDEAVL